jgi:ribose-phosphate pyrophosphokinase
MLNLAALLTGQGFAKPVCIVVHALFEPGAFEALQANASQVVSTESVHHASNQIKLGDVLGKAVGEFLAIK